MTNITFFTVFFLGLLNFSISNAQSDHLSVVEGNLQETIVNSPLSSTERDALVAYLEDTKQDYLTSMQQAKNHLDEVLVDASTDLKVHVKGLYFKSALLHIIGVNYQSGRSVSETEAEIFNRTITLVKRNSGKRQDLREIHMRLSIIEQRKNIVTLSLNDILQDNIYLFVSQLPAHFDNYCMAAEFENIIWAQNEVGFSLYDVRRAEMNRANRLAYGVRLDQKLISFYKQTPTLACSKPSWYQINPPTSGITYDASTHTFNLVADRSSSPTYEEFIKVVSEQINKH